MKKLNILAILVLTCSLLLAGCQKPNEIELADDDSVLEIESVVNTDTNLERTPIDSAAILPKDEDRFAGQVYLSAVKTQSMLGVQSRIYSKVVFEDRARPVLDSTGRRRGFSGINLGSVLLNGEPMIERLRRITNAVGGVEYVKELPAIQPRQQFTWRVVSLLLGSFETTITTPELLHVQSPIGGSVIPRNQDLALKWTGRGEMGFIISTVRLDGIKVIATPIFSIRVKKGDGRALLSKKVLKALPHATAYAFTFVLLNREEKTSLGRFNDRVLVQASSIYNSIVTLN